MTESTSDPFNWRLPFCGVMGAIVVLLPKTIFGNDVGTYLTSLLVGAIVALVLLIVIVRSIRRQTMSALLMIVVFLAFCWLLFWVSDDVHTTGRWFFQAKRYKAEVLAQQGTNNELKHVEWDGWGFAGDDTVVYLVFDPNDSLALPAKNRAPGKFRGIPCEVPSIHRLESHWYTVLFYTDTVWDFCG